MISQRPTTSQILEANAVLQYVKSEEFFDWFNNFEEQRDDELILLVRISECPRLTELPIAFILKQIGQGGIDREYVEIYLRSSNPLNLEEPIILSDSALKVINDVSAVFWSLASVCVEDLIHSEFIDDDEFEIMCINSSRYEYFPDYSESLRLLLLNISQDIFASSALKTCIQRFN